MPCEPPSLDYLVIEPSVRENVNIKFVVWLLWHKYYVVLSQNIEICRYGAVTSLLPV